jgi:hypothetical protein
MRRSDTTQGTGGAVLHVPRSPEGLIEMGVDGSSSGIPISAILCGEQAVLNKHLDPLATLQRSELRRIVLPN